MQVTIHQNELKAVAYVMAVKDIRYYLNGVLLETNGAETRLVATDGHRLHAVVSFDKDSLVLEPIQIILPDVFVKTLLKAKFGKHGKAQFTLTIDGDKVACTLPDGMEIICHAIDGPFPDYSRVIPHKVSGEYCSCNPLFILDAQEAYRAYINNAKAGAPDLAYNGDSSAILVADRFVAVIMPMRCDRSHEMPHEAFMRGMEKPEIKLAAKA